MHIGTDLKIEKTVKNRFQKFKIQNPDQDLTAHHKWIFHDHFHDRFRFWLNFVIQMFDEIHQMVIVFLMFFFVAIGKGQE